MVTVYVVQPGDSLWRIAQRFGVSLDSLERLNRPPYPEQLAPGQALLIPGPEPLTSPPIPPGVVPPEGEPPSGRPLPEEGRPVVEQYIVRPGDTLWRISQRFGVPVQTLIDANRIADPNRIFPGQVILIPTPAEPRPTPVPTPPPSLRPPSEQYRALVNGYLPITGEPDADRLREIGYALSYASLFSYSFTEEGTLVIPDDGPALAAAEELALEPLLTLANIRNGRFDSELAHAIFANEVARERLIEELVAILVTKGYAGLNVDLEYVFPEDREEYNEFMFRLRDLLHARGLILSSALAPKVRADQPGLLYEAHDYEAHGEAADFVVLMTYEWGWVGGPPMAIAPLNQVRRVLDYAVTAIPRDKILMGVPMYGRDWRLPWQRGTFAETLSVQDAIRRAIDEGSAIQYDMEGQSPYYEYVNDRGVQHIVWFEDPRSIAAKIETVRQYRLAGVSLWNVWDIFPQLWPLLEDRLTIIKP